MEDENDKKKPPLGVWIFWSLVGLLIIVRLVPWPSGSGNALSLFINALSALGALGAAIAAYFTVRELRQERREERHNRRPYFSFVGGEIGVGFDDEAKYDTCAYIKIDCKQVGTNPAANLTATATILRDVDNGVIPPEVIEHRAVNDVSAGFEFNLNRAGFQLSDHFHHHYVVLQLEYTDAIYGSRFQQTIYLQWSGLADEEDTMNHLYPITREVMPLVLSLLKGE